MTESERQKASSEYYSELKKQLNELLKKDAELLKISEKIRNNKANFNDTAKYSEIVSNYIAKVLQDNVGNISSPMGKEYVCKELLNAYYSTINDVLGKVQVSVDNQNNIHIRPQQAPFPAERVEQVAHSLEDATVPEEIIKRRSGSSVANVAKSFHDDFIKENADFRSKSGLKCYITRHSSGNCCKWCSSIAGKYSYKDAPHDVFRRHDNCNCTVTYENGRQRQNVWTKESWQVKGTSKKFQPVKLNHEQAKAIQQNNLNYSNSLKDKQAKMRDFIKQTGQDRDYFREQNYGKVSYSNSGLESDLATKIKNSLMGKKYLNTVNDFFKSLPNIENKKVASILENSYKNVTFDKSSRKNSYFNSRENKVYLAKNATPSMIAHELFHKADHYNHIVESGLLDKCINTDYKNLKNNAEKAGLSIEDMLYLKYPEAFEREGKIKVEYRGLSDIIHGMTKCEVNLGYGHYGSGYWDRPLALQKETFAQYGGFYYDNNLDVLNLVNEILPETSKQMNMIVNLISRFGG